MEKLHPNWLLEGWIDKEYKEYVLLDYVNFVQKQFNRHRLYPFLNDLVQHLEQANQLKTEKAELERLFPKKLKSINWDELKLVFETDRLPSSALDEIQAILDFAIPLFEKQLRHGSEHYEHIERQMTLEPVGIIPLEQEEGFLMLTTRSQKEVLAYHYYLSIFEHQNDRYRSLRTTYIHTFQRNLSNSLEQIKLKLIQLYKDLPNPATWVAVFDQWLPVQPTLLPISKRKLAIELAKL
jgi:hypothetical protein